MYICVIYDIGESQLGVQTASIEILQKNFFQIKRFYLAVPSSRSTATKDPIRHVLSFQTPSQN